MQIVEYFNGESGQDVARQINEYIEKNKDKELKITEMNEGSMVKKKYIYEYSNRKTYEYEYYAYVVFYYALGVGK